MHLAARSSPVREHDLGYGHQNSYTVHVRQSDLLPRGTIPRDDHAFCAFLAEQGILAATHEMVNYSDIFWGMGLVCTKACGVRVGTEALH